MTKSRPAASVGAQRPRIANVPAYVSSSGQEATELAGAAGLFLDPWQEWTLEQALGERADGKWSAFEVGLLVPRQNGKGSVLEARELAGLFLFGEELLIHSAHEFKTASEAFRRVLGLIDNTDDFRRKVKRVRTSHGEEGIELTTGQRLRFVARSNNSARGFTGDLVIFDEAYALTGAMTGAVIPTLSTVPNPQVWYTSSQGDETAVTLSGLRRRGHEGDGDMCFLEWSALEDADLDDVEAWLQANPGIGIRITEEYVARERKALEDDDFARERLGIQRRSARERVIPDAVWFRAQDMDAEPGEQVCFGVDVLPDRSAGAIVASGADVVELVDHRLGVTWLASRAIELAKQWRAEIVFDSRGPAAVVADEIEKAKVTVKRLSSSEMADACAATYDAIMAGTIRVRPHELLTAAVAGAVKRPVGDRFVWSRTKSIGDVTPLVAASMAFATKSPRSKPRVVDLNEVRARAEEAQRLVRALVAIAPYIG